MSQQHKSVSESQAAACRAMNDETVKATTKTGVIILGGGELLAETLCG